MHIDPQLLFNIMIALLIPSVAYMVRTYVCNKIMEKDAENKKIINEIRLELIDGYMKQSEYRYNTEKMETVNAKRFAEIMDVINKIFNRLDTKVDK